MIFFLVIKKKLVSRLKETMGCVVSSSLEVSLDDFSPYTLFHRLQNTVKLFVDLQARRRMHASQTRLLRAFVSVECRLNRELKQVQLDLLVEEAIMSASRSRKEKTVVKQSRRNCARLQNYSTKITTLLNTIGLTKNHLTMSSCTNDITMALDQYVKAPYLYYSPEQLQSIVASLEKSCLLTGERVKDFENLIESVDLINEVDETEISIQEEEEEEAKEEGQEPGPVLIAPLSL